MSGYIKGIDVSEHNGVIDWEKVKASGVGFAMVRAGYGLTADKRFVSNATECTRLGIPFGVYWFSYAMSAERAAQEAAACLGLIAPYTLNCPVAFDFEYDSVNYASKKGVTITTALASEMARAFCRTVRAAGYPAMNYANPDYLNRYFDAGIQKEFPLWLAQWPNGTPSLDKPPRSCDIWQYSEKGSAPGISGPVDLDVCYTMNQTDAKAAPMTGEQIYHALNEYLSSQKIPEWAGKELAEAVELGITDGKNPTRLATRYEAAILAKRALRRRS